MRADLFTAIAQINTPVSLGWVTFHNVEVSMAPYNYGQFYWCVRLNDKDEVYVHADSANVVNGTLFFLRKNDDDKETVDEFQKEEVSINLAFAPVHWHSFYAASIDTGHPIAVEHWFNDGQPAKIGFNSK